MAMAQVLARNQNGSVKITGSWRKRWSERNSTRSSSQIWLVPASLKSYIHPNGRFAARALCKGARACTNRSWFACSSKRTPSVWRCPNHDTLFDHLQKDAMLDLTLSIATWPQRCKLHSKMEHESYRNQAVIILSKMNLSWLMQHLSTYKIRMYSLKISVRRGRDKSLSRDRNPSSKSEW